MFYLTTEEIKKDHTVMCNVSSVSFAENGKAVFFLSTGAYMQMCLCLTVSAGICTVCVCIHACSRPARVV